MEKLDESNFLLYAAKHYDNPQCFDTIEFYEDLKRFKYIKRLFNRYADEGELKERLILNHIVILFNVFGVEPATKMLFLKCKNQESYLIPFLSFLNHLPNEINNIGFDNRSYKISEIIPDKRIVEALRKI